MTSELAPTQTFVGPPQTSSVISQPSGPYPPKSLLTPSTPRGSLPSLPSIPTPSMTTLSAYTRESQTTRQSTFDTSSEVSSLSSVSEADFDDMKDSDLHILAPPEFVQRGALVACPDCTEQIRFSHSRWRQHITEDLAPYLCTAAGCLATPFEEKVTWVEHELLHPLRRKWPCDICESQFTRATDYTPTLEP